MEKWSLTPKMNAMNVRNAVVMLILILPMNTVAIVETVVIRPIGVVSLHSQSYDHMVIRCYYPQRVIVFSYEKQSKLTHW